MSGADNEAERRMREAARELNEQITAIAEPLVEKVHGAVQDAIRRAELQNDQRPLPAIIDTVILRALAYELAATRVDLALQKRRGDDFARRLATLEQVPQ